MRLVQQRSGTAPVTDGGPASRNQAVRVGENSSGGELVAQSRRRLSATLTGFRFMSWLSGLSRAFRLGESAGEFGAGMDVEFVVGVGEVRFDRLRRDE
jgi:hypothetical protein